MALTATQEAQVRMYLGYSDMSRGSAGHIPIEGAMDALSAEAQVIVADVLTKLATLETSLSTTTTASRAGIIQVEDVKWERGNSAQTSLYQDGRRLVARLAIILGVPVIADVFGSALPTSGPCPLG